MNRKQRRAGTKGTVPVSVGAQAEAANLFEAAIARHQAGQLAEAEKLYRQILAADEGHAGSSHLLGVLAHQVGRNDIAVELIGKAIGTDGGVAIYHSNLGVALKGLGRFEEALAAYDASLRIQPDFAEAHSNRGNILKELGRIEEAVTAYDSALRLRPDYAEAHCNRGIALKHLGRAGDALSAYDAALRTRPDYPEAHFNRAILLASLERFKDAVASYAVAILIKPDYVDAYSNRAVALMRLGRRAEALATYRAGLRIKPDYVEQHCNHGGALNDLGRFEDALKAYAVALCIKPDYADAHYNQGVSLNGLGRVVDALAAYTRALYIKPGHVYAHSNRGTLLNDLGRHDAALGAYTVALCIKPEQAEEYYNRGNILRGRGRLDEAMRAYAAALHIKPDYAKAHINRANSLRDMGRLDEALAAYRTALCVQPAYAKAHANCGNVLRDLGRLDQALTAYDTALRIKPAISEVHSNRLLALHYSENETAESILFSARTFGSLFDRSGPSGAFGNTVSSNRRLRIGYVSGDFGRHPVGYFLETVLASHARPDVEVFCYSAFTREDDITVKLRVAADHWRSLVGLSDMAAADMVRADGIDILIDLSGHTGHNRLTIFALRAAPVQATWLGYFGTTGLTAMDYILADRFVIREGEDKYYTEQVCRLPDSYLCFSPPDLDIPLPQTTEHDVRPVTFGSFNNNSKTSAATIALWSRLLHHVPGSRLLLKTKAFGGELARRLLLSRFAEHGIGSERLILEGAAPRDELLAAYNRIDVALDPTPYGGGTTTVEALWMGVPVVTLRGGTWVGRVSESLLSTLGLASLVAGSALDYIDIAARIAADVSLRGALRSTLRSKLVASPICDASRFTRSLEAAYREMWQEWCDRSSQQ